MLMIVRGGMTDIYKVDIVGCGMYHRPEYHLISDLSMELYYQLFKHDQPMLPKSSQVRGKERARGA